MFRLALILPAFLVVALSAASYEAEARLVRRDRPVLRAACRTLALVPRFAAVGLARAACRRFVPQAAGDCSGEATAPAYAASRGDCPECATGAVELGRITLADRRSFDQALAAFESTEGDGRVLAKLRQIRRDPEKLERFRAQCRSEFGISPTTVREWLALFLEFAPRLIDLILKFV